jgi:hypothetical protein
MYGLVDKTYIEEPITTSSLQSQDFVDTLMVIDTRRVDEVERKSLDTEQCQENASILSHKGYVSYPLKI